MLDLSIGPLALSDFFEVIQMYCEEFLDQEFKTERGGGHRRRRQRGVTR